MLSASVSNRTGTSNSNPAVTATPVSGAVSKVTMPVAVSTAKPLICSVPSSATRTVPATGFAMVRVHDPAPDA